MKVVGAISCAQVVSTKISTFVVYAHFTCLSATWSSLSNSFIACHYFCIGYCRSYERSYNDTALKSDLPK